ncbi:class A beta-lactamase [Rothia halotolerans]|uniref:class A beta-lactamase n=1 Tax=Rothia halotolerans TaxID=405770 RepID=UPI00101E213F|nr:class A beta-lactamase [Rothia halotolerans]
MSVRHIRRGAALALIALPFLAACGSGEDAPSSSASASSPESSAGTDPSAGASSSAGAGSTAGAASPAGADSSSGLESLEAEFDARIGVSALDTGSGDVVEHRADERFGYASSLKVLAAAELLQQVPADQREERVTWTQEDVDAAGHSPVTSEHLDEGLTYPELAEAAVRQSDNTAMNLMLARIGGPAGLDAALEELGDTTTEVVNEEPALNAVEPGGTDDTTSPSAFTADLDALFDPERTPQVLDPADRETLIDWMSGNPTGDTLIRAGAPEDWAVAEKSGGAGGIRNDVAIVTPPDRAPIVITVLTQRNDPEAEYDDALVARAAEAVLGEFE